MNVVHLSSRPEMHTNEQTRTISGGVRVEVEKREREHTNNPNETKRTETNQTPNENHCTMHTNREWKINMI